MSPYRLLARVSAALLLAAVATGAGSDEALTTADLVRFLTVGVSERSILAELDDRGFAEPLDAAREASLRQAGASETLVVAVRRAAGRARLSPATPAAASSPRSRAAGDEAALAPVESHRKLTFSATARSVRVPVSVLDKRGEPVLGLRGEDFQVSEDGRQQPLTFFSGERRPLRIALALDVSMSMTDKMGEVADALQYFIDLLEPADEILVITFSGDVNVAQDFTSDRDLLERVFSRLQAGQGTALHDAAIEAIRRVAPGPAESKAVVLVTDGVDTASRASFEELREVARRSEVPVFSIGIGGDIGLPRVLGAIGGIDPGPGPVPDRPGRPGRGGWPGGRPPRGWPGWPGGGGRGGPVGPPPSTEPDFDGRPLSDLADDTGGRAEMVKGEHDRGKAGRIRKAVESIAVTLRHRYLVGYEPEGGRRGWRRIRVEVDRPSVRVQARKGYYIEG